jgi:acyl-CoA thioester hydrolase
MSDAKAFHREYLVRVDDINYGGHMGNERALVVFQDARIAFLGSLGLSEKSIAEDTGIIIVEARVEYRRQAFMGDLLDTAVTARVAGSSALDFLFSVSRPSDGAEVFSGSTRILPFSYAQQKVRKLPPDFLAKIAPFLAEA